MAARTLNCIPLAPHEDEKRQREEHECRDEKLKAAREFKRARAKCRSISHEAREQGERREAPHYAGRQREDEANGVAEAEEIVHAQSALP